MWLLEKIRGNMGNIPLELSRYMSKSEGDVSVRSQNLHCNILTPDKIPEFCLPPRLCKRNPQPEAETIFSNHRSPSQSLNTCPSSNGINVRTRDESSKERDILKPAKKPYPFSAEGYGLGGVYESPNTRRKESLFHSMYPVYMFDRTVTGKAPKQVAKKTRTPMKTLSEMFPMIATKYLSETGSTESETQSSSDSSPITSPYGSKSSLLSLSSRGQLKAAVSGPSWINNKLNQKTSQAAYHGVTIASKCSLSCESNQSTLKPPLLFPLDILQCQERLQCEHLIPLLGRGRVRLAAEHTTFSKDSVSSLCTVRVRVVSVEGLWENTDRQPLTGCAVCLCLTPGKLQHQESATIRNCRTPVFNEDFFFIELTQKNLQDLQLRLKVMEKPAAGTLRRGTMIGLVNKPLSELLMKV